jgi:hypothetical protein
MADKQASQQDVLALASLVKRGLDSIRRDLDELRVIRLQLERLLRDREKLGSEW